MSESRPATTETLRFGVFEVDPSARELRKHGIRLKLQDQPFAVLLILLEKPGLLVTKEELQNRLWAADMFVEFDKGIYNAMKRLRETLSDDAETPRYIETIPKRGYRFIAAVQEIGRNDQRLPKTEPTTASAEQSASTITPVVKIATGYHWTKRLLIVAAAIALICGGLVWRLSRNRSENPVPPMEIVPLAGLAGLESEAAFSPDGNHVAFVLHASNSHGIFTTAVGSQRSIQLTNHFSDCCPKWSPNGRQIAFSRYIPDKQGLDLYVVPALGGTEHQLSPPDQHLISLVSKYRTIVRCFDWAPNGKVLAFSSNSPNMTRSWISILSLVDSTVRPLTSPPSPNVDYAPAFSPDGSTVAFIRGVAAGVVEDLYLVPVAGGTPKRLTFDNAWMNAPPAWTPDGRDIVFSSTRSGYLTLWRVAASGGSPQSLPGIGPGAHIPSISSKGHQLLYQQSTAGKVSIWRLSLKDQTHSQGPAKVLMSGKGGSGRPSFSPDGKRIAFESDRLGYSEIWACDSDGSNCDQLTSLKGVAGAAHWSPDGRYIAFEYRPKEHSEIYLLEVASGVSKMLATLPGSDNGGPNWSRDGKSIYFYSDQGGGSFQIWKTQASGESPIQITKNGGVFAAESPDGRFLYYSKYESPGIWKMPLNGGEEIRILDQPAGEDWWNWGLMRDGIYFLDQPNHTSNQSVKFFDFKTEKVSYVAGTGRVNGGLSISPDNNSIVYAVAEPGESTIMLVENFR